MRGLKILILALLVVFAGCANPQQRVDGHVRKAVRLMASHEYRRAWRELEKARNIGVPCPQVDAIQGMMLARRNDLARAEDLLESAVSALPSNHAARNNLALIYLLTRRAPEALRLLEPSVKSTAPNSSMLNNYGLALRVCGETARARKAFEQAMRANPRNADATANYAMCLYLGKRVKEAVAAWETAVYIDGSNSEAWAGLCIGRAALGDRTKAHEAAFRTMVTDSSYTNMEMLVNVRNWPRAAAADFQRIVRSMPRIRRSYSFSPMMVRMNGTAQLMEDPLIAAERDLLATR